MRILMVHNSYQKKGGEDVVFEQECSMLESNGHRVIKLCCNNDNIRTVLSKIVTAFGSIHSFDGCASVKKKIIDYQPELMHVHNFFPKFSPSIFNTAHKLGVATVFTLHNFRTVCPSASFLVNGKIDERSLDGHPYKMVSERVYKGSLFGTFILATMIQYHKLRRTWLRDVDSFIALSEFNKKKFIQAGFNSEKITIKPNFVLPNIKELQPDNVKISQGRYGALYVGRVTEEKGLLTLLKACNGMDYPLTIIGDGEIKKFKKHASGNVNFLGERSRNEVEQHMKSSSFLVLPSEVYEGFPMTLCESYFAGLPVIASDLGSLAELVVEGKTGLKFKAKDSQQLRIAINYFVEYPEKAQLMGKHAKKLADMEYTEVANYKMLMDIYNSAISRFNTIKNGRFDQAIS